jgi:P-type Cu+ transporter
MPTEMAHMAEHVDRDEFVIIKIEGMHCHRCESTIQQALAGNPGVHEAEVDFASGQASVLYDPAQVKVRQLMKAISEAGYHATGFTQCKTDRASPA